MKRLLIAACLSATSASAAQLIIQNTNAAGQGFNDTTPVAPVGLNYGTTQGAQAVITFQYAAAIWGATLKSTTPIVIDAAFVTTAQDSEMTCSASSGLLGFTTPVNFVTSNNLPNKSAGYVVAEANALLGSDQTPGQAHIRARFNAGIGTPNCLPGLSWYYGLDINVPAGQVSLLTTLLHEFSHGLGFASFVSPSTGSLSGAPSSYDFHVFDETAQNNWAGYQPAQRLPLLTAGNELSWDGPNVASGIPTFLSQAPALNFSSGGSTSQVDFVPGQFSGPIPDAGAAALPVAAANPLDACSDLAPNSLAGSLGLIERGTCNFYDKAQRAITAGASGVVIFDNDAGPLITMASPDGGTFPEPSVFITNQDGNGVLQRLDGGAVTASFGFSSHIANTDQAQSRVLLYTPGTVAAGSTLSHWNSGSFPVSLLMEPFIGITTRENLDLTPAALADMGWPIVTGLSVGISKAEDAGLASGEQAKYLVSVINHRVTGAAGVTLDLSSPAGTTFVSATGSGCTALPCDLGTVDAGEVKGVVVALQSPSPTVFPYEVTAVISTSGSTGVDNLNATVSSAQASAASSGGGGGCSSGGVPAALVAVLALAVALRTRRRRAASSS
jgi:uncharacterized protein (TIGR03382 family)